MTRVSFQCSQDRDKRTQKRRSRFRSWGRRRCRFKTASYWRRARFSSASSERVLSAPEIRESSRRFIGIMAGECQAPRHGKSTVSTEPAFWRTTGWWKRMRAGVLREFMKSFRRIVFWRRTPPPWFLKPLLPQRREAAATSAGTSNGYCRSPAPTCCRREYGCFPESRSGV
jgi:hypothetical protein